MEKEGLEVRKGEGGGRGREEKCLRTCRQGVQDMLRRVHGDGSTRTPVADNNTTER